jgi:hypothetical protein
MLTISVFEIKEGGTCFVELSGGVCSQIPLGIHAMFAYPPLIYYLTEKPPPHGKILKKGPDKISNKVVYVYCVT